MRYAVQLTEKAAEELRWLCWRLDRTGASIIREMIVKRYRAEQRKMLKEAEAGKIKPRAG